MINIFLSEKSYSGRKANKQQSCYAGALKVFFKKTLDKQNDQVLPEIKVKVNNGRCL